MKYLPFSLFSAALLLIFSIGSSQAQAPRNYTSSEILLQLKKLNTVGSVLYIAAHPDDENTRLIAYLANEKCLRTGYLSLTRGDGGQNLIGPEQGVELGVIRTQELLAARRIDGGEQFFTRAYDFGYSKTPKETFQKWNHDSVLSDVVWVIRNFRPDIIITRFATDGSGGHGHHTASAILAEEAFDAAGDPKRFPEQLQYVDVWQPRRLFWNVSTRFANPNADMSPYIKLDVGGYNPLLGKSYGEIAAESRSMHKSQGFGSAKQRGEYFEYFKPLKGDTAGLKDIFQGIDFTWGRFGKKTKSIQKAVDKPFRDFDINNPSLITHDLLKLRRELVQNKWWRDSTYNFYSYKMSSIYSLIELVNGVFYEFISLKDHCSIGDSVLATFNIINRSNCNIRMNYLTYSKKITKENSILLNNYRDTFFVRIPKLPVYYPVSNPYYLKSPMKNNMYTTEDQIWRGMAENQNVPRVSFYLIFNSDTLIFTEILQYKFVEPDKGEIYKPFTITPPFTIGFNSQTIIFCDTISKFVDVKLTSMRDSAYAALNWYSEWNVEPAGSLVKFLKRGEEKTLKLKITPDSSLSQTFLKSDVGFYSHRTQSDFSRSIKEIKYDHIPIQTLFPQAEIKLIKLDVKRKLKRIGYIPGAGDEVAPCLTQLGYEVITITDDMLAKENLNQFEAIVTGVRAYNTNEKLPQFKQKLMDYVAAGGNLIVQYNTNSWAGPLSSDIGPYKFKITRDRITDENAAVKFLLPQHPVFNYPNKITEKDFEGWIQERSIYHAGEWDSNYVAPISMADPDEKPNNGALIIAGYGKGHFVYTGLVFFRELPAGVPGAYRLFVNILELGK
ncbi:MAG: PIG-L family deacetylase [Bacteroidia bacterium]|nr:PIG-L family deacetylase [Bacteroidia bacterium]